MITHNKNRRPRQASGWASAEHAVHAFVEIVDGASVAADVGLKVAKAVAAVEAVRKYNWIRRVPVLNSAGNLRGMVVDARWAAAFHFAEDCVDLAGKIGVLASLATSIAQASGEIEDILDSDDTYTHKGARLLDQVGSICIRTAGGGVLSGVDLTAQLAAVSLGLAGRAGLHQAPQWGRRITSLDARLDTWFNTVTDGNNIYLVVQKYFGRGLPGFL